MSSLIDALASLPVQALGTVVHLGAGRGETLAAYAALRPRRLVLVEGDAEAAAELRTGARAIAGAGVVEAVVMPSAQTASWQRHSLTSLDGPIAVTGLARYYPRLRRLGALPVQGVALDDLLGRILGTDGDAAVPALLVIDLPGQEAALLDALPPERLHAFDWLLLRGCSEPLADGVPVLAEALARLPDHVPAGPPSGAGFDPLWPVALLRLDRRSVELRRLAERLAAAERAAAASEVELAELKTVNAAERERHALQAAEQQQQALQLEAELAEMSARQRLLQEELVRAEAQTELIADLLLREVSL